MPENSDIPQVSDRREKIIGVLPRTTQGVVLGGIALLMLLVILFSGHTAPRPAAPPAAGSGVTGPNQTHIQDYRALMDQQVKTLAAEEAELDRVRPRSTSGVPSAANASQATTLPRRFSGTELPLEPGGDDPAVERDRRRREYQSLFASNMALTYRSSGDKRESAPTVPVATAPAVAAPVASGPARFRLFEGTFLETVLTNRLDSSFAGPVNCMVTTDVYSQDGRTLLIPQGTRVLGDVRKLESFGDQRLAVSFHRMIMPDGFSLSLDQFHALDQIGETGLRDEVNHHYLQIFGVSAAIGAFAGLAQANTRYSVDESVSDAYQQGVSNSLSQSALHILDRYLNVLPTFTIREGYRVKVYLSQDLLVPAYSQHPASSDF